MTAVPVSVNPKSMGPALVFLALTVAVAVAGAALALAAFTAGAEDHDHAASVGEPIATSFGSVTVEHVTTLGGLTSQELGGVTHGISNLVLAGDVQVEVSVVVANRGDKPVSVVPDQFSLTVAGSATPVAMSGATIKPLRLRPGGTVEATLTFVVPQSGQQMTVGYADPDGEVITVPAGQLDLAPASPDDHTH